MTDPVLDRYFSALTDAIDAASRRDLDAALDAHARAGDVLREARQRIELAAADVLEESQRGAA